MARRKEIVETEAGRSERPVEKGVEDFDTRLGKQRIDLEKLIVFPRGIMGFEDKRRFTLLKIKDDAPFLILQCLDDPKLGLLVGDPYTFLPEYVVRIGDAEQSLLQVSQADQLSVLVTVSIPPGHPDQTTLNLTGPILINHDARIGLQVPQVDANPPRLLLRLLNQEAKEEAEQRDASADGTAQQPDADDKNS